MSHSLAGVGSTTTALMAASAVLALGSAAEAQPPPRVLARICAHHPSQTHCTTTIRFVAPTPQDQAHVAAPFTVDVAVSSREPVALVRYFFRDAVGGLSSANRETGIGYAFEVQGVLAERLRAASPVNLTACAYSVTAPNGDPLTCTAIRTLVVG